MASVAGTRQKAVASGQALTMMIGVVNGNQRYNSTANFANTTNVILGLVLNQPPIFTDDEDKRYPEVGGYMQVCSKFLPCLPIEPDDRTSSNRGREVVE